MSWLGATGVSLFSVEWEQVSTCMGQCFSCIETNKNLDSLCMHYGATSLSSKINCYSAIQRALKLKHKLFHADIKWKVSDSSKKHNKRKHHLSRNNKPGINGSSMKYSNNNNTELLGNSWHTTASSSLLQSFFLFPVPKFALAFVPPDQTISCALAVVALEEKKNLMMKC